MINASEIADTLAQLLRDIPALVAELGGDPGPEWPDLWNSSRIQAYHDEYPYTNNLQLAVTEMPPGSLLLVYAGRAIGARGGFTSRDYNFTIYLRMREQLSGEPAAGFGKLDYLIHNSIPDGKPVAVKYLRVLPNLEPMNESTAQRVSSPDGLDHFEIAISFTEIGDD